MSSRSIGLSRKYWFSSLLLAVAVSVLAAGSAQAQWGQWGGPRQDFKADCGSLAKEWPETGPKKLWSRKLGEGYSAIIVDDGVIYTMYRVKLKGKAKKDPKKSKDNNKEVTIAMKADSGEVLWEHKYDAPLPKGHVNEFGKGPRGTPAVSGNKLYTIGVSGKFNCYDKKSGKVLWSHDLLEEYQGTFLMHGYSSSPYIYKDLVITMVGGEGHSLVAFNKNTGKEVWKKLDFGNSYSTPKLIDLDGKDQLVCFMATEVIGIDPKTGELEWSHPHKNQWKQNITLPIWNPEDHILFITASGDGSRGLKLTREGKKTKVEELWTNKKLGVHFTNAVRVDDHVYASSGGMGGAAFFYCINAKTGEITWKNRGFAKASFVYTDGRFYIVDEDGKLGMARATPKDFDIIASLPLLKKVAWTVPTIVGKTLYVRDQDSIMAIDIG